MLRILYFLLLDSFFLFVLCAYGREAGGYIFLILAAVAYFTWELIRSFKHWLN